MTGREGGDQAVHPQQLLGAYSLGALSPAETREVDAHLPGCPRCRRELAGLTGTRDLLGEVPPEAFLDGPPADGELLLARIMRTARAERDGPPVARGTATVAARPRWRRPVAVAAAVAVAAGVFAGGLALGRQQAPTRTVVRAAPSPSLPPGTLTINEHDPGTGVGMAVRVIPKVGWVEWLGTFTGVPPGTHCVLVIVTKSGQRVPAGAWVAPQNADTSPVSLSGTAIVVPKQVSGLEIDTTGGRPLVTWSI
jgi:Putative zinc-finger